MFASYKIKDLRQVKETEKAVAFKAWKNYIGTKKSWEFAVWIPKSIIKDGEIPGWFISKKEQEWEIDGIEVVTELA